MNLYDKDNDKVTIQKKKKKKDKYVRSTHDTRVQSPKAEPTTGASVLSSRSLISSKTP